MPFILLNSPMQQGSIHETFRSKYLEIMLTLHDVSHVSKA